MMHSFQPVLAVFGLGAWEIVGLLLVFMLLFGAKRLPDLAKSLGRSISEFKKGATSVEEDVRSAMDDPAAPPKNGTKPAAEAGTTSEPK